MIDPIPVTEELRRISQAEHALRKRAQAGKALGWLSEYALSKTGGGLRVPVAGTLGDKCPVVVSSTPNVAEARSYLDRAFREHERAIIKRAIELAETDFALPPDA